MSQFPRRIARWMTVLAVAGVLGAGASPAEAAAKRKAPAKTKAKAGKKRAVATERLVSATKAGQPNVQALGSLVIDETGVVVYQRNPDKERPIASISKLAAMLVVMDKGLELEGLSTINKTDVEVAKNGAKSRLLEGMTLSNRDLLHAALMGSDNRAVPALGRAVKLTPAQLANGMNAKAKELGLKNTRFMEPTGLSINNVSTPREVIAMLKQVVAHPVLGPITRRAEYEAHPVGKPPIKYNNTDRPAARGNTQLLGGKTGYNDVARYCLVVATKIEGRTYYMAFLGDEGKMTRFGDVARVADWVVSHKPKTAVASATTPAPAPAPAPQPPIPIPFAAPVPAEAGPVSTAPTQPGPVSTAPAPLAPAPTATP